jgi:hypothetical protein
MNGGSPFSYSIGNRVIEGGVVYTSLTNSNTTTPPGADWSPDLYDAVSGDSGYLALPSGIIIQWVTGAAAGGTGTAVTLPTTFPNHIARGFVCFLGNNTAPSGVAVEIQETSTSVVTVAASSSGPYNVNIFVIGY